jgi:hypothetical protein
MIIPHPEGGYFKESIRHGSTNSTRAAFSSIYFLLTSNDIYCALVIILNPHYGIHFEHLLNLLMHLLIFQKSLDVDVRDVIDADGLTIVYAEPDQFAQVQDALRQAGHYGIHFEHLLNLLMHLLIFQKSLDLQVITQYLFGTRCRC